MFFFTAPACSVLADRDDEDLRVVGVVVLERRHNVQGPEAPREGDVLRGLMWTPRNRSTSWSSHWRSISAKVAASIGPAGSTPVTATPMTAESGRKSSPMSSSLVANVPVDAAPAPAFRAAYTAQATIPSVRADG